jgi:hypothetical protein
MISKNAISGKTAQDRKIIFYLHFHKCAGTFIHQVSTSMGYRSPSYKNRDSGNACFFNGNLRISFAWIEAILCDSFSNSSSCFASNGLPFLEDLESDFLFSDYTPSQVQKVLEFCVSRLGLTFISFESSFPNLGHLPDISENISWLTSLRSPVSRIISNYIYDCNSLYGNSFEDWPSVTDLQYATHCFMQPNLYTKQILFQDSIDLLSHINLRANDGLRASEILASSPVKIVYSDGINFMEDLEKFFCLDLSSLCSLEKLNSSAELLSNSSLEKIKSSHLTQIVIDSLKELNEADIAFYKSIRNY